MLEVITQHMCKSSYFVKEERLHSGHQGSIPTFSPFYTGIRLLSLPHVKQYGPSLMSNNMVCSAARTLYGPRALLRAKKGLLV